jgi:RNA polymerase sigma factor (sigma-70 family)
MEVIKNFSDAELIANIQAGKSMDESIKAIYREYYHYLAWYVQKNSGTQQDAEDVFQEVVVSFIDLVKKNKFRGESSVKTFLYALNRHMWLNELKRRGRATAREAKYEQAKPHLIMDASYTLIINEDKNKVYALIEQLGSNCKKILLLYYYENQSMKEILTQTDYETEQVVRNKKYKCLKQLEQLIAANPALKETLKNLLHGE